MKKNLTVLFVFISAIIWAQSSDQNYVKTTVYATPNGQAGNTRIEVNYFDGLGRPIENVKHAQAPNGGDIITHIEYDDYGRQIKEYLPVVRNSATMDFEGLTESDVVNFYQNTLDIPHTGVPYSKKELEKSPLNRVLKQAAPGEDWAMGSGHEIKFDYQTNQADEVRQFEVAPLSYDSTTDIYETTLSGQSTSYQPNTLYKNITIDENNNVNEAQTIEFKNKAGQVVLKRTTVGTQNFDTYYVYDDFGNLTYVIPPKASGQSNITQNILDNLCYQYKYDKRNRMVAKKIPGKQWEYMVYDKLDRLRATGPVASPFSDISSSGWLFTKYDAFDRPVMTLWVAAQNIGTTERINIQNAVNDAQRLNEGRMDENDHVDRIMNSYTYYSYPTTGNILTINYYDDYAYYNAPSPSGQILGQDIKTNVKTLPTGTWDRILESSTDHHGKLSYTFYKDDHLNSPIYVETRWYQPYTQNAGGYLKTSSQVDFEGKVLKTLTQHKKDQNSFEIETEELFTYSPEGRLIQHQHRIGNEPYENIATNTYDLLGQVKEKKVGNTQANPLQKVDYRYNIRGWLTEINDVHLPNGDLFYFHLGYTDGANPLYNGNISQTQWRTAGDNTLRSYEYSYDKLNRLTEADYLNVSNNIADTYNVFIDYDKNGNIMHLHRNGGFEDPTVAPAIDQLTYGYATNSNQLLNVSDATNDAQGFKDGNSQQTGDDYDYDAYGNMIKDQNKGITHIKYNHMNLPKEIDFVNNRKISYLYTAMGTKIQKTIDYGSHQVVTDYCDGYQYETKPQAQGGRGYAELLFFPTAEGYVKALYHPDVAHHEPKEYQYIYIYKDHLGNNRLSYTLDPQTEQVKILEENHYYPFGLKHGSYNNTKKEVKYKEELAEKKEVKQVMADEVAFKYKYNGKELQDELGLNWYDYGARNYQADLGRWHVIDPLAEKFPSSNPYEYAFNNPTVFIDPDGMENIIYVIYTGKNEKEKEETDKMIEQANSILKEFGLETRLVAFSSDKKFERDLMDENDGLILIGDEESVKSYDRKNNLSGNWDQNRKGEEGWKTTDGGYTPETTRQGKNRLGYVTSKEKGDRLTLFTLHSMGHQKKYISQYDDHCYGKENYPNIMSSGIDLFAYMRRNGSKAAKEILSIKRPGNVHWKERIINNFGTNKAVDNYEKNDNKRIGPRRADGSF